MTYVNKIFLKKQILLDNGIKYQQMNDQTTEQ